MIFKILLCLSHEIANCLTNSAGASLNEASRTTTIGPQFSGDLFLVVTLQNNNRHTSARAQKFFPLRNMRPLSIREAPRPGGGGYVGSIHRLWQENSLGLHAGKCRPLRLYKPYSTVLTPTRISLREMFVQNVNYFVDCHRGIAQPDGMAVTRVLKYLHLPSLAGNCSCMKHGHLSHLSFAILQRLSSILL